MGMEMAMFSGRQCGLSNAGSHQFSLECVGGSVADDCALVGCPACGRLWRTDDRSIDDRHARMHAPNHMHPMHAAGACGSLPPEVSFDFWLDGSNRVEELGSEISDVSIIRSDIQLSDRTFNSPEKCPCDVIFDFGSWRPCTPPCVRVDAWHARWHAHARSTRRRMTVLSRVPACMVVMRCCKK